MRFLELIDVVDFDAGGGCVCVSMLLNCAVDDPVVSLCPLMELTAPVIYG
jgi:hypothetical protein